MLDMLEQHAQHVAAAQQDIGGDWQRFYLGYAGRFVDDCVLQLQLAMGKAKLPCQADSRKGVNPPSIEVEPSPGSKGGSAEWQDAPLLPV
ncbi:hypothetical protein HaLaN_16185, partial [Haematococcus lacustris]